jgi:phage shock protein A
LPGPRGPARTALERKSGLQAELAVARHAGHGARDQQEQAGRLNEKKLRQKIEAFRTKKEVIKAPYSLAEAQVRISRRPSGGRREMADVGLALCSAPQEKTEEHARAGGRGVRSFEAAGAFDDLTTLRSRAPGDEHRRPPSLAQLSSSSQVERTSSTKMTRPSSGSGD